MNTHAGYSKRTLTDTSVLLAGGGDKPLSGFIGSIQYNSTSHKITYTTAAGVAADLVTLVTTDENVKQSPQDNNVNRPLMMINGGTGASEQINTTIFSSGIYANTSTNMITAGGFIKSDSDNSHVLLGDGGHKSISDFHMFVNLSIGWANDFIRVVIALCVIDVSNTGTDSNNIGTLYTRRLNGLCADSIAQVSFNNKYSGDYTYYYSLITNHENTGVSKTGGEGFRPCTFIYNNKHYAGLEFHLTQARAFYWHGSGTFTPFIVTFYNLGNLSVLNSEVYNSLTFGTGTKSLYHLHGSSDTWYTARTLTIGNSGKFVNGSNDVSWTLTEIGIPTWALATNKPSYNLDEVTDGTTRKLSDYVTLVGVTDDTTNHANLLRYVKNGVLSYFTVPYATHSNTTTYIKCLGVVDNTKDLNSITDGLWHNKDGNRPANTPGTDNDLILLLSSCGLGRTDLFLFVMSANSERLYFRERYNNNTWRGWHTIAWLSDIPTVPSNIVNTFGTKTGDITLLNGLTGNGTINLTMSGNQLQASIVGLGARAYDSNTYIRELDYYRYDSTENKAYRNYSGTGTADYLKNLSMFAYDKAKNEIIGGRVHPNGLGIYLMRTYSDTGSTTGVPKYSGGLYLASSGCEAILFGYSNNNWFCNTIYHTGNLPAYPIVNNSSLTLLTAGTTQTTFYANDDTNRTFNVTCENIGAATSTHNHNDKYVTFVGVTDDNTNHKNQLRYVLNGISNYFTVPYASTSDTAKYLNTNSVNANRVHKEINSSTSSYMYHLILLVAVLRTSNSSAYNYLEGKFFMFKTGGNVYDVVTVNLNLVYNTLEYHIEYYGLNGAYTLCRCTYNGILYYALKCPYHANPFTNIIFDGYARSDWDSNNLSLPIDITYRCDYPSVTITNSEVNNSLTNTLETNVVTWCGHRALALPAGMIGNASSATNVAWSGITSKPNAVGDSTHPVYWTGSGFTQANAYPTKASWNYDDVYLKLSGGTMTGTPYINMPASAYSIADNQPFGITYGKILCYGDLKIAADTDGSTTEYIILTSGRGMGAATKANGLAVGYNSLTWKDNNVLHAGNSSVSKSGETLTVNIGGTSYSLTNTWRGILNNLTSDSTTDSLSAALGKALKGLVDGALKLTPGSIASFGDYQRVVIALCETKDGTASAGDSYTVGEFQYHRSNGLCLTFSAHVNMNAAWGISRGAFYSLVTDYENTSTAARDGSGFRACTFTYNGKYYAGLEFYYTQGHYWTYHGISNFTPFVVAYYDIRGKVVNSEINNSLRYNVNSRLDTYLGTLRANGNVYASNFYTTSDRNKKTNISSFSEHICKFQLKDTEKWHYGVIAQEVEEMFRDGEEGNMTVNYNSILSFYIGSLENSVAGLEDAKRLLENKVRILEERIKRLESK